MAWLIGATLLTLGLFLGWGIVFPCCWGRLNLPSGTAPNASPTSPANVAPASATSLPPPATATVPPAPPPATPVSPPTEPPTVAAVPPTATALPPTAAPPTGPTVPPDGTTIHYVVQPGDTLLNLAKLYHTTVEAIMVHSGLTDPNRIYAGEVLTIVVGDMTRPVPPPTMTMAPPGGTRRVTLDDDQFTGGAPCKNCFYGKVNPRSAVWVYGASSPYGTMSATFILAAQPDGQATLTLTGMDLEGPEKTPMRITINAQAQVIYEGLNPLPDDASPNTGTWGDHSWTFTATWLQAGPNTLTIENLAPTNSHTARRSL